MKGRIYPQVTTLFFVFSCDVRVSQSVRCQEKEDQVPVIIWCHSYPVGRLNKAGNKGKGEGGREKSPSMFSPVATNNIFFPVYRELRVSPSTKCQERKAKVPVIIWCHF